MAQRLGDCLSEGSGEIALAVKMPLTYGKTERPRGALLQLGIDLRFDPFSNKWEPSGNNERPLLLNFKSNPLQILLIKYFDVK